MKRKGSGGSAVGEPIDDRAVRRVTKYVVSFPERILRAVARRWGTIHETAELVLRGGRTLALLRGDREESPRITVELVGGVERETTEVADEHEASPKKLAVRKVGGNVVELGSILAFGFSPLWLLAGAADVTRGTRVYLDALVGELKAAGVVARESEFASVDDLLAALEGASGTTARLIDIPPLEVEGLKRSLADLRHDAKSLPTPPELAAVYQGLLTEADREQRSSSRCRSGWASRSSTRRARSGASTSRSVHAGPAPAARRGVRRLCAPRRLALRPRSRATLRPGRGDADRARARAAGTSPAA